ncbi:MAG: hypothetical protein A2X84_09085 [Desulfuromonadaceae bacterium GWC2_58_13]|nr:MAG: hypothetical protein A2X84_09085 [Desulfuromonadaceae bacterium GWC2_58_13]
MNVKLQVLVVDDDQLMVKTLCDILRLKGHDPIAAHSGEEAVAQVRTGCPDCVLMDIKMQGMDGVEALKRIRKSVPGLPVVLMSAFVTEERMTEAKGHGVHALLTKPVEVPRILAFLDRLKEEIGRGKTGERLKG